MGKKFNFDFNSFTYDQIREMSEDDLYKNINSFKRMIREAGKSGRETHTFEVEFCYLEHERLMRDRAREVSSRLYNSNKGNRNNNRNNRR